MKVDKGNPRHWLYLVAFSLNVLAAILIRPLIRRPERPRIILYGHKLNGNLLVLYRHLSKMAPDVQVTFLTMDPVYHARLREEEVASVSASSRECGVWLATASAVIADRGLHAMQAMVRLSSIKFFDVWHGVPFKGFDAADFRFQRGFEEIWVASPLHKQLYVERFGVPKSRVRVTGYARTDRLVRQTEDIAVLRGSFGLPAKGKVVLFAPTWQQDSRGRSIYPFGMDETAFLEALSSVAHRHGATIAMRAHLNSGTASGRGYERVVAIPQADYPDTEGVLLVSDVLVCDWSSISFDYLLLKRPTIFLDVPPPFRKGFSLGPEYRFGLVVGNLEQLLDRLEACLRDAGCYWTDAGQHHEDVLTKVYDRFADGYAGNRCVERLASCTGFRAEVAAGQRFGGSYW